jgi:hypothetical protein
MSAQLRAYLRLERLMLELDEVDEPSADVLRDLMEPLWYALTDEHQQALRAGVDFEDILSTHGLDEAPTREQEDPNGGVRLVLVPDAG